MRRWVITTGKGELYVTSAATAQQAITAFQRRFQKLEVASCAEVTEF